MFTERGKNLRACLEDFTRVLFLKYGVFAGQVWRIFPPFTGGLQLAFPNFHNVPTFFGNVPGTLIAQWIYGFYIKEHKDFGVVEADYQKLALLALDMGLAVVRAKRRGLAAAKRGRWEKCRGSSSTIYE